MLFSLIHFNYASVLTAIRSSQRKRHQSECPAASPARRSEERHLVPRRHPNPCSRHGTPEVAAAPARRAGWQRDVTAPSTSPPPAPAIRAPRSPDPQPSGPAPPPAGVPRPVVPVIVAEVGAQRVEVEGEPQGAAHQLRAHLSARRRARTGAAPRPGLPRQPRGGHSAAVAVHPLAPRAPLRAPPAAAA